MKTIKWPAVSVAIATRNSQRTLSRCLESVRLQDYPSEIEIVLADGGSIDNTLKIAKKFRAKVVHIAEDKQNAEYNKGVAVNKTTKEVILMIDHDNILPHKDWLKKMVKPLIQDKEIFGAGVLRFHYDKTMSAIDRYSALLGGTDPIPFFFNKSAHQSYLFQGFHLRAKLIKDEGDYYKVRLSPNNLPALGGNGSIIKRNFLFKAKYTPDYFFHIDVHVDITKKGYTTYAFVKDTIIHLTGNNFFSFLRRRRYFIEKYYFEDQSKRRYSVYDSKKDKKALVLFIIYSATVIMPIIDAIRGFSRLPDLAWFIHPFMCLGILVVYGITSINEVCKLACKRVYKLRLLCKE